MPHNCTCVTVESISGNSSPWRHWHSVLSQCVRHTWN